MQYSYFGPYMFVWPSVLKQWTVSTNLCVEEQPNASHKMRRILAHALEYSYQVTQNSDQAYWVYLSSVYTENVPLWNVQTVIYSRSTSATTSLLTETPEKLSQKTIHPTKQNLKPTGLN